MTNTITTDDGYTTTISISRAQGGLYAVEIDNYPVVYKSRQGLSDMLTDDSYDLYHGSIRDYLDV